MEDFWHILTAPESHAPRGVAWGLIILLCALCAGAIVLADKYTGLIFLASIAAIIAAFIAATGGHLNHFVSEFIEYFPLDGWRTPSSFAMTTLIWGLFAWGTKVMQKARRA